MPEITAHNGRLGTGETYVSFTDPATMVRSLLSAADLLGDGAPTGPVQHWDELHDIFQWTPLYVDGPRPTTWSISVAPGHNIDADVLLKGILGIPLPQRVDALLAHMTRWANGECPSRIEPVAAGTARHN